METFFYSDDSDQDLLNAMKQDDSQSFNEIYKRYWKGLFTFANNILEDQGACEDIVQDIFTQLYLKRKEVFITNLKSYLFQAVKFQAIKHLRRNKLHQRHIDRLDIIKFANQTEQSIDFKELDFFIKDSLLQLQDRCGQIFRMSRYEYLSHEQIAEKLGISTQTVKNQITKALNHLRANLDNIVTITLVFFYFQSPL